MDDLVLGQLGLVIVLVAEVVDHFCRDPLAFDDPDLVGHDGGFPDVVGNEHCGDALFLADLEDELLHLGSGQGIKGSEGVVQKQELGRGQEGGLK